ncbi:hypothetical protein AEMCBJ_33550 (plasmid) [Cupriavidus necator]|uniref:hypothetical protein n=1 Tax=Cupriavidus necator TaxID=106590 RepID=UPI003F73C603
MAWTKMPSAWLIRTEGGPCPLAALDWATHRTHATAALVLLLVLAIRLNLSHRGKPFDATRGHEVALSYDEMREMTGFAKATVLKAVMLLEGMGAIVSRKEGRRRVYALPQVAQSGQWCQLPQDYLLTRRGDKQYGLELEEPPSRNHELKRLRGFPFGYRAGLNAMKLYVLFVALRNQRLDTTAISYDTIMGYTGMRRADIPEAFSLLVAHELARAADERDGRDYDRSKRYRVLGLGAMVRVDVVAA